MSNKSTEMAPNSEELRCLMDEALRAEYPDVGIRVGKVYLNGEYHELICVRSKTDKKELPVVFEVDNLRKSLAVNEALQVYREERDKTDYPNAMLDSEWVLDNIVLEVTSEQYHDKYEILPGTIKQRVDGTDLDLIPCFKLLSDNGGVYDISRVQERYFDLFKGIISREDLYQAAERNMDVSVEKRDNGFIHVLPSAKIFCKGYLEELLGEDVKHGVFILPYTKEESMLYINKLGEEEIPDESCVKAEMKDVYTGSRAKLISLKVVTMENRLSSKLYYYKEGKYSVI